MPIPVSVVSGDLVADTGAFNVNRLKELIPRCSSTRPIRATRRSTSAASARPSGSPTTASSRASVSTSTASSTPVPPRRRSTSSTWSGSRCCADRRARSSARTRPPAPSTSRRASPASRRQPTSSSTTATSDSFRRRPRSRARSAARRSPGGCRSPAPSATACSTTPRTQDDVNDLNNLGVRGQLLFAPVGQDRDHGWRRTTRASVPRAIPRWSPASRPRCAPANRQYPQIAADLGYTPPSFNAFDRLTDIDTPLRSYQDLGGASLNVDWKLGPGRLTSTTAWRYWDWNPSNDRDFIGLPVTTISAAPSTQRQWTQEVRYAGDVSPRVNLVVGAFAFRQTLDSDPSFKQEQGAAAARFLLAPSASGGDARPARRLRLQPVPQVPERQRGGVRPARMVGHRSPAPAARPPVQLRPEGRGLRPAGLRRPADDRSRADRAAALDPRAAGLHGGRRRHQPVGPDDRWPTGSPTSVNAYATVCDRLQVGRPQPERRAHRRAGPARPRPPRPSSPRTCATSRSGSRPSRFLASRRTSPSSTRRSRTSRRRSSTRSVGVLRGYLANAEKVRVRGVEFDGSARVNDNLSFYGAVAYTDGKYVSFPDAPPPLEDTGGPQVKDISGSVLPGISKWALSLGGEYVKPAHAARPGRRVLRRARRQLSLLVLLERERLAVSGGRGLLRCSTPGSASGGRMAGASPCGPATCWTRTISSCCHGGAWQLRSLCRAARRSQNLWRDAADRDSSGRRTFEEALYDRALTITIVRRSTPLAAQAPAATRRRAPAVPDAASGHRRMAGWIFHPVGRTATSACRSGCWSTPTAGSRSRIPAETVVDTFAFRRLRPYLRGRFSRRFEFYFNPDFAGGTLVVQDAYVDTVFAPAFRIRAGKGKTPFGLERLHSASNLLFFNRALPTALVPNRDIGIQVLGDISGGVVSYLAGVMNGVPDGGSADLDTNDGKDVSGRFMVRPFNKITTSPLRGLGLAISGSTGRQTGAGALPAFRTAVARAAVFLVQRRLGRWRARRGTRRRPSTTTRHSADSREYVHTEYANSEGSRSRRDRPRRLAGGRIVRADGRGGDRCRRRRAPAREFRFRQRQARGVSSRGAVSHVEGRRTRVRRSAWRPPARAGRPTSWTAGLNWYLTPNFKYMFNFERTVFDDDPDGPRKAENAFVFRTQVNF